MRFARNLAACLAKVVSADGHATTARPTYRPNPSTRVDPNADPARLRAQAYFGLTLLAHAAGISKAA